MSIFGWSYPAGAENDPHAPYNMDADLDFGFLDLQKRLKELDSGRWDHVQVCITGKDADLETHGSQGYDLVAMDEESVTIRIKCGVTIAGNDVCLNLPAEIESSDDKYEQAINQYLEEACEIVCGFPYSGDWSGDDWYMYYETEVRVIYELDEDGLPNLDRLVADISDAFDAATKQWDSECETMGRCLDVAAGWYTSPRKGITK